MLGGVDEVQEKLRDLPEAAHSGSTASMIYLSKDAGEKPQKVYKKDI